MNLNTFGITLFLLFCFSFSAAQSERSVRKSELGILLESNLSTPKFELSESVQNGTNPIQNIEGKAGIGFAIGVMYKYHLNDFLAVRTQPTLAFLERKFLYSFVNDISSERKEEALNIELPIHLVFEKTTKKYSPSLIVGGRYGYDIAANSRARQVNGLNFRALELQLDVGVGLGINSKLFTIKPEIVYSKGIISQLPDSGFQTSGFKNIKNDRIGIRLLFYK